MKTISSSVRLVALPLALAAAFPSVAQTQLKEVVVTATRVAVPVTDVIADVTVIDRTTLAQAGSASLRDVLAQQPGVQIVANGSYRSTSGVFLRGASTSQTLVLIDGVRVGSATSGGASFESIPLDRIDRIEILRGAASALYGPDAVGGVIQIFTREPTDALQLSANAGAGTDGQAQASASIRGSSGVVGYSLGVSSERATGISAIGNTGAGDYNPDSDGFRSRSLDAKVMAKLSANHDLTLSLVHSDTAYQFDGKPSWSDPNPLGLTQLTSDAWAKPTLDHASLKWGAQWLPSWKSTFIVGSSEDKSVSEYYRASDGAFGGSNWFNTSRRQVSWQNDISLDKDVLSFLLENRVEVVDSSTNYAVKERDVRGAMVSYALNRSDWNALAVLRNDENSQFGHFNNWAVSGGYKLSPSIRAVASMGTSFQAPTFNQLYWPGYGSPTLTPQLNRGGEAGLRYQRGAVSIGGVVYYNEIQGFIEPATNVQNALAVLRGVTLNADARDGNTSYAVSYDYADPHTQPNDLRFVRVAQNVLNVRVSHRLGVANVFGEVKLSSDREDNNLSFTGRDTLAGYGILNVGGTWKLRPDLSLLARVNNVTDTRYVLANGYSMPGRNLFVSLSWAM